MQLLIQKEKPYTPKEFNILSVYVSANVVTMCENGFWKHYLRVKSSCLYQYGCINNSVSKVTTQDYLINVWTQCWSIINVGEFLEIVQYDIIGMNPGSYTQIFGYISD